MMDESKYKKDCITRPRRNMRLRIVSSETFTLWNDEGEIIVAFFTYMQHQSSDQSEKSLQ